MLQEGEIKLLDGSKEPLTAFSSGSPAGLPLLPSSVMNSIAGGAACRRKTADQVLIGSSEHATTAAGSRLLIRQLTSPSALLKQPSMNLTGSGSSVHSRLGGLRTDPSSNSSSSAQIGTGDGLMPSAAEAAGGAAGGEWSAGLGGQGGLLPSQVARLNGVVLAVMGSGSFIGENILGYDPCQVRAQELRQCIVWLSVVL